jgi:hypothetical protein
MGIRMYKYKMQWLFEKRKAIKFVQLVGAKSLDVIYFRDHEHKIIDEYSSMHMFDSDTSTAKTIAYIKRVCKFNHKIFFVEVVRR